MYIYKFQVAILMTVTLMMLANPNLVILDGGVQYLLRWQLLEVDDTQKPLLVILQTRCFIFLDYATKMTNLQ